MKKVLLVCMLWLTAMAASGQGQAVTITWSFTNLPANPSFFVFGEVLFSNGSYGNLDIMYSAADATGSNRLAVPAGLSITYIRIIAVEGCGDGTICDAAQGDLVLSTDPCVWQNNGPMNILGASSGIKLTIAANLAPELGLALIQSTPQPSYCPQDVVTMQVPCNMQGRGLTFNWYYNENNTGPVLFRTSTNETLRIGEGQDFSPRAGVLTTFYAASTIGVRTQVSGSVRYGAAAPTTSVVPIPPTCADGSDWAIEFRNTSSTATAVTRFKASIFSMDNNTGIPDGAVSFDGALGRLTKANILSSRVFKPGTDFKIKIANDYDPTNYGVCERDVPGTHTIANAPKITMTENTPAHQNVTCNNVPTGSVQLNVTNGNGVYTISLNDVATPIKSGSPLHQPILENLAAATYLVKLRDTKCKADSILVTVTQPAVFQASIVVDKALDCSYSNDGQLRLNVTGGITPYNILWSNGDTDATAGGLVKGTYGVTVSDQGCPQLARSEVLNAPDPIVVTLAKVSPRCPEGTDGSISITNVQNAPGVVTYLWNTGDESAELLNVAAGHYTVTVTSKSGGKTCSEATATDLVDPTPWTANIVPALDHHGSAISCHNASDGRLDVVVRNAAGTVTNGEYYTWSTGENGALKTNIATLPAGSYEVRVRYNSICEAVSTYDLYAPAEVTPSILANSDYHGQLISCHDKTDASLRATVTGGTGLPGDYTYLWSNTQTTTTISALAAGTYTVTVKDANQCPGVTEYTIENPQAVGAVIADASNYSGYGVTCYGLHDGSITAEGTGGTGTYTYAWSGGQITPAVTGLAAGLYEVTVTDNNGCSIKNNHEITEPDIISLGVADSKNISCFDGSDGTITLAASGGTEVYTYSRDNINWQNGAQFTGLVIGTYQLRVRDGNGCATSVSRQLTQPPKLAITFRDILPAFCADPVGTATGDVAGGVGGYQYAWALKGNATVIGHTNVLAGVAAGFYRLSVRDGNNCPVDSTVVITSTDGAQSTYTSVDTKCFDSEDGSAKITITQGEGPFTILWPDGQTSLEATSLEKGTHYVQITDGHNCTVIEALVVDGPDPIDILVQSQTVPTCYNDCNGILTLNATGGVGGYHYYWNNGTTATQTNLCAGRYVVHTTDDNGCMATEEFELEQPDAVSVSVAALRQATCTDGCNGMLEAIAAGGNGGYTYTWATGETGTIRENICPGSYGIHIVDSRGCKNDGFLLLPNTPQLPLDLGGGVTLCVGQTYRLDAGNTWTHVQWGSSTGVNDNATAIVIDKPGSYWVDVVAGNGCTARDTFLLATSYDLLQAQFLIPKEAFVGDTVAVIDISYPLPESISWTYADAMTPVSITDDAVFGTFDEAGTYAITLTAHLGECLDEITKMVTILESEEDGEDEGRLGAEEFVKAFTLFPNPNDGRFDVGVELLKPDAIILSVWSSTTSSLMGRVTASGSQEYLQTIDLRPLPSGAYVLRLDYSKGHRYIRFIVH